MNNLKESRRACNSYFEAFFVKMSEMNYSADLGGSSKYNRENLLD